MKPGRVFTTIPHKGTLRTATRWVVVDWVTGGVVYGPASKEKCQSEELRLRTEARAAKGKAP